jgi:hypothetical protein
VEHRSSKHPAQFASEKALMSKEEDLLIWSQALVMYFIYLIILLIAAQCVVVGVCKYWQTLLTEKEISGLVRVKYYKAPKTLLAILSCVTRTK